MSTTRTITDSALIKAIEVKSQVNDIAFTLPENELYQVRKRMLDTINDLEDNILDGFALNNKIERVRRFVNIVGRLMECKDYLDYIHKSSRTDVRNVNQQIDELSNLLLINSGTLN
ncbi:hypothetical protein MASR1M45_12010 [Candidatus Kapaibacterium sp.]